jgi:hypothetical protein
VHSFPLHSRRKFLCVNIRIITKKNTDLPALFTFRFSLDFLYMYRLDILNVAMGAYGFMTRFWMLGCRFGAAPPTFCR